MAPVGTHPALSFRETLARHLDAIQRRDLAALADTVAPDALVLISADGKLKRSAAEFLEAHRGWFAMENWTLDVTEEVVEEAAGTGIAVLRLLYQEPGVRQESLLTLVFRQRGERWLMVLDQNTPSK